ncbi:MAG: glycosyltransferase WbuB [Planctomycetes bacterium]|nr:glycosyltransferase WbuB [Planctomycetota bacterium]
MHLLFLTDNFPPEVNAPASRTFEHCREWVRKGHRVTVITCAPNFPKGKVFDGYQNKAFQTETIEGIEVIRVWSYITANEGFVRRILDYLSFMASAIVASPRVRGVDLVIGTSPQFFTAVAAYVVSRMKRIPYVFELRDLWPESIKAVGAMKESFAIRMLERLEMFLYRKAARIVSVTESFKQVLMRRGIARARRHPAREGEWQRVHLVPRMTQIQLVRKACGIGRAQHHLVADQQHRFGIACIHVVRHAVHQFQPGAEALREHDARQHAAGVAVGIRVQAPHLRQRNAREHLHRERGAGAAEQPHRQNDQIVRRALEIDAAAQRRIQLTALDGADQFSGNLGTQVQPAQGLQTRDQRSRVQVSHHAQTRHIRRCPLRRVGPVCTGFHGCCTHGPAL